MKFVGVDLHKQSISVCVVDQARHVLQRRRFLCADTAAIRELFASLGRFRFVVINGQDDDVRWTTRRMLRRSGRTEKGNRSYWTACSPRPATEKPTAKRYQPRACGRSRRHSS